MRKLATNAMVMLLALVGCMGCGNRSAPSVDNFIRVDVMVGYPEKKLIFQDLTDAEYVALEIMDDSITKGAVKAIGKGIMLVMNRSSDRDILVFDKNGEGLRKISRLGQSGEEYTQPTGLVSDEDNDETFVKDSPVRKIGAYDLLGNYKRGFELTGTSYYNYIFNYDHDHLICYKGYPSEKSKWEYHLIIFKQDGRTIYEIQIPSKDIETPIVTEEEFAIALEFYLTFLSRDKRILVSTSSDTISHYLPNGNLSPFTARSPSIPSMDTKVLLFSTVITDRHCFTRIMRKEADFTISKSFLGEDPVYDKQENILFSYILYNDDFINKGEVSLTSEPRNPEIVICQTLDAPDLVEAYKKGQLKGKLKEIAVNLDEKSNPVVMLLKKKK